jgi:DNA-binding transcriptional LysR family regulator
MEFSSVETILGCVLAGMGITFLPRSVFSSGIYDDTIDLFPLPTQVAAMPINFVTRKVMAESKALEAFRSTLKTKIYLHPETSSLSQKSSFVLAS